MSCRAVLCKRDTGGLSRGQSHFQHIKNHFGGLIHFNLGTARLSLKNDSTLPRQYHIGGKTNLWNCIPWNRMEPAEPKEITVFLQLPLANVTK